MQIKLLSDRVLIEADETETKTGSGLIVSKPKGSDEFQTGKVVLTGRGKLLDDGSYSHLDPNLVIGSQVVFQYGKAIQVEGKSYQLVNEADIIMVV
jgi:co-chaperonin GroES (HSP10)